MIKVIMSPRGLFLVVFIGTLCVVQTRGQGCKGFGDAASEKTCKTSKSKTACLKTMTLKTQNLTASCVWQDDQSSALVETQKLTSNGIPLGIKGLNYQKNICGVRVKVDLPKEAKSRWGVNVRLWGGPGNVNDWHPTTNPDIPITTSGCTASKGAPLSCSATLVAPTGYTLDPNFVENTATLDFFTSDRKRIRAWKDSGSLPESETLSLTMTYEYLKCTKKKSDNPKASVISDRTWFGITSYQMYDNLDKGFFDLSYRSYKVSNTTKATWKVNITDTIGRFPPTKLITFLLREKDYQKWSESCIRCYPPIDKAIKGTFCEDTTCLGEKKYLGRRGEYRLMVAFPEVCNAYNDLCYSHESPRTLKNGYTKQLVEVNLDMKLKLPKPQRSGSRMMIPGGNARTSNFNGQPEATMLVFERN